MEPASEMVAFTDYTAERHLVPAMVRSPEFGRIGAA
jgi:hypothetical protein